MYTKNLARAAAKKSCTLCKIVVMWIVMGQSLPAMAKFINANISEGPWSNATVTGLFENINREGSRNGGYHKGRYRISSVPLEHARDVFEVTRQDYIRAAVVACQKGSYEIM